MPASVIIALWACLSTGPGRDRGNGAEALIALWAGFLALDGGEEAARLACLAAGQAVIQDRERIFCESRRKSAHDLGDSGVSFLASGLRVPDAPGSEVGAR